jgi:hypothetical protein
MKCKIIRDDLEIAPGTTDTIIAGQGEVRKVMRNGRMTDVLFWKRGAILGLPDAWRLVRQGVALPEDEACEERCGMTPEQLTAAQMAYERVSRGIHPDDYALFDAGVIEGYQDDGSYKPGPYAAQHPQVFEDDEDDDE